VIMDSHRLQNVMVTIFVKQASSLKIGLSSPYHPPKSYGIIKCKLENDIIKLWHDVIMV